MTRLEHWIWGGPGTNAPVLLQCPEMGQPLVPSKGMLNHDMSFLGLFVNSQFLCWAADVLLHRGLVDLVTVLATSKDGTLGYFSTHTVTSSDSYDAAMEIREIIIIHTLTLAFEKEIVRLPVTG